MTLLLGWIKESLQNQSKGKLNFFHKPNKCRLRFFNNPLISALVWRLLKCDWSHYCGALPSFSSPGSKDDCEMKKSDYGPWHRDTYSLFGCEEQDQGLPPFYLTLIVPLQEVTQDLGPTEFVIGSHTSSWSDALKEGKAGLDHLLATSKRGDCVLFDGRMIHRGTPCRSTIPRRAVYMVFHKKWYADYIDSQFSASANAHGIPRDPLLPSGFKVPLNVCQPTGENPTWRFTVTVPITKGEVIWTVGQGDSLVFDSQEQFDSYQKTLSCLEAREAEEKSYHLQVGKIVVRRDLSSLVPADTDDAHTNISVDDEGNWIAAGNIAKDEAIVLASR